MTRTAAIMASYDHGASNQPLLGETIGENFNRMAMTHADREALVDRFTGRRCPDLRWVVLLGSADWLALPASGGDPRALAARQALLSPDDPINIQYTSGTTGHPKGATLSHHNILNNAHLTGEILGYTELDRVCVPVPLYHTFGMVIGNLGATTHGACLVYPAPAFDPAATLAAVEEERCTSLYGVPAMFIAELAQPGFDAHGGHAV